MSGKSSCFVLAIVAALAQLPCTPAVSADEMLKFEARLAGFADPKLNDDGTISNTENAVGQATYLGLFAWESVELAVPVGPNTLLVEGSFTITTANGDQLEGTYVTTGAVDWETFTGFFSGPYWVTVGTGRFAQATGTGTIIGIANLADPYEIVGSLSGTMSQPNQ